MRLMAGTRLGPYEIERLLGAGGMGEVYRAHDPRLKRTVAVKVLAPGIATADRVERFEQEARAASALNHPNILTIHDVGREQDVAYFAMEWVDGETLRHLMRAGPIPLRRTLHIAQQVAEGLAKAHAAGIVHRDLKPENVMITKDGLAKIVDFGLAKLADAGQAAIDEAASTITRLPGTDPGFVMGTAGYMSPEQASGRPLDYRSDQFALGLLIYELVTRTRPFARATTAQSLAATIESEATPIEALNPQVPPHLAAVVARCLAKDPSERYESTRDLARDLKAILESSSHRGIQATPKASVWSRRMPVAGAAILLIAAGLGAAWLLRRGREAPVEPERPLVAVRPFRSLSSDPAQGFFAAGMTDEIRGQLSQVASLRLLSRNALDGYKDTDAGAIVRELGITNFVDGSVRVDGTRVRITAELIDAATQETRWSNHYDRELADLLAVQSDVALQITQALHANLSTEERQRLARLPTGNPDAYALYLQAQQLASADRAQDLAAIELLRKALALDPGFAVARAGLAYRLIFMGYYDDASYVDKGIAEAQAALRLDPSLAAGYVALATGYSIKGRYAEGRQAFLRALELNPNQQLYNLSILDGIVGRLDDSLYWARRGFGLSGKRPNDYYHVAVPLINLREDAAAHRWLLDGERRYPTYPRIQLTLAITELLMGRLEDAIARTSALHARLPQNEEVKFLRADVAFLADSPDLHPALEALMENSASNALRVSESVRLRYAYVLRRQRDARSGALLDEAERIARERMEAGDQQPALRIELAAASLLRGNPPGALEWMSRAYDAGYRDYGFLERDPILAPLREESRFRDVLERMRQDVAAQLTRARERGLVEIDSLLAPPK